MKRLLAILLLIAAVLAMDPVLISANDDGTAIDLTTVAVHAINLQSTNVAGAAVNLTVTNDTLNGGGVSAAVSAPLRVRDGKLYAISATGASRPIAISPERARAVVGARAVKAIALDMKAERPIYAIKAIRSLDTGEEVIPIAIEVEIDAETGEITNETAVINPKAKRIKIKSSLVKARIDNKYGRIYINRTRVNDTAEMTLEVVRPKGTLTVHVVKGEGATVTMNGVVVNTKENMEIEGDEITVADTILRVLPEQARAKLHENAEIREIKLERFENKLQYRIKAVEKKRILGIIPADVETEADVDVETGETKTRGPWWGFLAF